MTCDTLTQFITYFITTNTTRGQWLFENGLHNNQFTWQINQTISTKLLNYFMFFFILLNENYLLFNIYHVKTWNVLVSISCLCFVQIKQNLFSFIIFILMFIISLIYCSLNNILYKQRWKVMSTCRFVLK